MTELFLGDLFFRADRETKILELIYERCGTPNDESWPEVRNLERYNDLKPERICLRTLISYLRTRKPKFKLKNRLFFFFLFIHLFLI